MKRLWILLLALAALCAPLSALADGTVRATGTVNLREGPGLGYEKHGSVKKGTELFYLGETQTDERGVDWYSVEYRDEALWISSRYSELTVDPEDGGGNLKYDPEAVADYVEVIDWYGKPLTEVAAGLKLDRFEYVESEAPNHYYNDAVLAAGWELADCFDVTGQGYTLYGVHVGMDIETAKQKLTDAGLQFYSEDWCVCFEHPVDETSIIDFDSPTDYNVLLEYGGDGDVVGEISLSTYTG